MLRVTEEEYLQLIEKKLDKAMEELVADMDLNDKDIAQLQELYWENYSDFDEYGYEEYENRQQILNHVNSRSRNMKTLHMYKKMKDSPYFARVDFVFDGEEEPESCYIGIGNFSGEKGGVPLIYDWRAPISSLFYDYDTGRASYEAPAGIVEGEIVKKLQYKIKKGKLIYAVESDIKIDDDILKEALSMNADARMKSIVSTIQREQNSIIRNEKDRILIVQGGAGSGKTSVALHRIAYLLYRHREELKASQVLILSPNDVFADYISHILPELGEENINELTFDDYAAKELAGIAEIEDHYDFLEDVLCRENENNKEDGAMARQERLAYRGGREFVEKINAYALTLEYELMSFKDVKYKKLSKDADSIADLFYNKLPDIPLFKRMDAVCEYVVDEYTTLTGHELDEIELAIVQDKFADQYVTRDILKIYSDFLESLGEKPVDMETRRVGYEDVYGLLYLKSLLFGTVGDRRIKHLIIDEMQDYSYIQYCIIGKLFHCPMTILGDKEQSVDTTKSDALSFLPSILGKDAKRIVLNKSYRSTVEITEFAAAIAGIRQVEGIDRHGNAPVQRMFNNEEELIDAVAAALTEQLSAARYETFAVLCKTQEEARYFGDKLLEKGLEITVLNKETDRFRSGIVAAPFYLAKGLEFDCVHMVNADKSHYYSDYHRQILYIGATRALHELAFYGAGERSVLFDPYPVFAIKKGDM